MIEITELDFDDNNFGGNSGFGELPVRQIGRQRNG